MASPFPGMDPYLEGSLWTTVHFSLGAEMVRLLAPRLRPRYVVLPVERVVMGTPDSLAITTSNFYPDVAVLRGETVTAGAPATAVAAVPLQLATIMPTPIPHVTVEIRDMAHRQLVTAIEILSPTNKQGDGREEYLSKRRRILVSPAHLLEIDLLRQGQRVPMEKPLPPASYFVFLSRAEKRPLTEVWPIYLDEPLPTVPVPLLAGDPDVSLDLQEVFTNVYDLLAYDLLVDYSQPAELPLAGELATWAHHLLQMAHLRP